MQVQACRFGVLPTWRASHLVLVYLAMSQAPSLDLLSSYCRSGGVSSHDVCSPFCLADPMYCTEGIRTPYVCMGVTHDQGLCAVIVLHCCCVTLHRCEINHQGACDHAGSLVTELSARPGCKTSNKYSGQSRLLVYLLTAVALPRCE
jgi:hypothetical protein